VTTLRTYLATLRDYQRLAYRLVLQRLREGNTRLYVSLPTGTGKSVVLSALAARMSMHGRVLVLVHLQDLVVQLTQTLTHLDLDVGMLMQGYREIEQPVVVATPSSLLATLPAFLWASNTPVTTVLIDEAHHAVEDSPYAQILVALEAAFPDISIAAIGFTATPYRSDTHSMFSVLRTCAFIREIPEMIQAGWLAPLTWLPLSLDIDLSALPTTLQAGESDYAEGALAQTLVQTALMEAIVQQVTPHLHLRPTLVFAISVAHAEQLAACFRQVGYTAVAISGRMSQSQREHIYADWRAGNIQIVCNCSLLTEGFDFPALSALVMARPTRSPGFYVQMLGRGMRPAPGKQDCLVIDVMGNNPALSHQMVLPQILGVSKQDELHALTGRQNAPSDMSDALLQQAMGGRIQTGLSLLDPLGASPYRWCTYHDSYFTLVNSEVVALIEPDRSGSGLYHSRLYITPPGHEPIHQWIEHTNLPLRQQVALVHEATRSLYRQQLGSKDAPWLDEPATNKQLATLHRLSQSLAEQAARERWTKGQASEAITVRLLRRTLDHPPSPDL
jgi:ATP-dependent helicase IRC3